MEIYIFCEHTMMVLKVGRGREVEQTRSVVLVEII